MNNTLVVNEIYLSIQGESTFAGLPCVFVRLAACNLRCSYCDTAYAFSEGRKMAPGEIRGRIAELAEPFKIQNPKSEIQNPVRLPLLDSLSSTLSSRKIHCLRVVGRLSTADTQVYLAAGPAGCLANEDATCHVVTNHTSPHESTALPSLGETRSATALERFVSLGG